MFGSIGFTELILILVIVLIIFGAGKLPQLGEGLGKAIKGFKKSVNEPDSIDVTPVASAQEQPAQQPMPQGQLAQPAQAQVPPPAQSQPVPAGSEQPKQG